MGALRRVAVIIDYEWRRALAKKKILALIILAVAFQTLIMVVLAQFSAGSIFESKQFMWLIGVAEGQGLFTQLIAIIIAGGSMSEEYEHGTADTLLSKPITRIEYMSGKFLGGFSLLAMVEALTTSVGVVLGVWFFGPQNGLEYAPLLLLAIIYSSLIFFCTSFMFSEVFRRSTLAMLVAFAILLSSSIISQFLALLYNMTGDYLYFYVSRGIPTWGATYFPSLLMAKLITMPSTVSIIGDPLISYEASRTGISETVLVGQALQQAAIIIAVYAVVFMLIATFRLIKSDVAKKAD